MIQRKKQGHFRGPKPGHSRRPKFYKVICSGCGKEVLTQVSPPDGKKLFCLDCFGK